MLLDYGPFIWIYILHPHTKDGSLGYEIGIYYNFTIYGANYFEHYSEDVCHGELLLHVIYR